MNYGRGIVAKSARKRLPVSRVDLAKASLRDVVAASELEQLDRYIAKRLEGSAIGLRGKADREALTSVTIHSRRGRAALCQFSIYTVADLLASPEKPSSRRQRRPGEPAPVGATPRRQALEDAVTLMGLLERIEQGSQRAKVELPVSRKGSRWRSEVRDEALQHLLVLWKRFRRDAPPSQSMAGFAGLAMAFLDPHGFSEKAVLRAVEAMLPGRKEMPESGGVQVVEMAIETRTAVFEDPGEGLDGAFAMECARRLGAAGWEVNVAVGDRERLRSYRAIKGVVGIEAPRDPATPEKANWAVGLGSGPIDAVLHFRPPVASRDLAAAMADFASMRDSFGALHDALAGKAHRPGCFLVVDIPWAVTAEADDPYADIRAMIAGATMGWIGFEAHRSQDQRSGVGVGLIVPDLGHRERLQGDLDPARVDAAKRLVRLLDMSASQMNGRLIALDGDIDRGRARLAAAG